MAVISSAVRNNLLALQNTSAQQAISQNRLATGKKVNSALDNPTNFFTASSLSNRASGLSSLLDGMANGIKTLEAADNGMTAIKKNIESMQANIRSARADKSFQGQSLSIDATTVGTSTVKNLALSDGAVGTTGVNVSLNGYRAVTGTGGFTSSGTVGGAASFTITAANLNGGSAVTVAAVSADTADTLTQKINDAFSSATGGASGFKAENVSGQIKITSGNNTDFTIGGTVTGTGLTAAATTTETAGAVRTTDQLVSLINANSTLTGDVKASNDGGKLRIDNLSTKSLTLTGVGSTGMIDGSTGTKSVGGNEVRKNLMSQFNDLRTQVDKLAGDASFNGINLLKADKLKITFNDDGTNNVEIQAKSVAGDVRGIDTSDGSLGIGAATEEEFSDDTQLDARLDSLSKSLTTINTQSSTFGSALTTIQTRQDFTKSMINTLQAGSDNLVNADLNQESATLLALNTRQQLSQTALSLASQADQAVLRLF